MKTKAKSIIVAASIIVCFAMVVVAWATVRVVTWVSDLPNRISIQIDDEAAGQTVTWLVTESARESLTQPDPKQQLECLRALADGIDTTPDAIPWIQAEFADELATLQQSPDSDVAKLAEKLTSASPP
jgi:hypothetical protein